jgi:hypothetical protein
MHEDNSFVCHKGRLARARSSSNCADGSRGRAARATGIIWHSKKIGAAPLPDRQTDVALRLNCQRDANISNVAQGAMFVDRRSG